MNNDNSSKANNSNSTSNSNSSNDNKYRKYGGVTIISPTIISEKPCRGIVDFQWRFPTESHFSVEFPKACHFSSGCSLELSNGLSVAFSNGISLL